MAHPRPHVATSVSRTEMIIPHVFGLSGASGTFRVDSIL